MIRFLHTSDWQLGMTRHFLSPEAQARFTEARFESIRTMAAIAAEQDCAFVVVAGDVFETNQVDRRTVARAFDALAAFDVPVYLLPGNHDCLDPTSVFTRPSFEKRCPDHVHVLLDATAHRPCEGVEVVGAPWRSKAPLHDLVAELLASLEPAPGHRVVVAHGSADTVMAADRVNPAKIEMAGFAAALADGRAHYLALGDRHSKTEAGPAAWYSGAPEPTSYRETDAGEALVVELSAGPPRVAAHRVGTWHFHRVKAPLSEGQGVESLAAKLDAIDDKRRAIVKLSLQGSVSLAQWAKIETLLDEQRDLFAALEQPARHRDVVIVPDDSDFSSLDLKGWADTGRQKLEALAGGEGPQSRVARDALGLLLRLASSEELGA